jgi:hypothetical protein
MSPSWWKLLLGSTGWDKIRMMLLPLAKAAGDVDIKSSASTTAAAASTAAVSTAELRSGEFQIPARDSGSGSHLKWFMKRSKHLSSSSLHPGKL